MESVLLLTVTKNNELVVLNVKEGKERTIKVTTGEAEKYRKKLNELGCFTLIL